MNERTNWNQALILDDNPQSLNLLRRVARGAGYLAVTCGSIEEFKNAYVTAHPTLVVLDLIIGEEDCAALFEFLAKVHCKTPIVLVTGHMAGFLDSMEMLARSLGLEVLAKVEKRKTLFKLEDCLIARHIPELS